MNRISIKPASCYTLEQIIEIEKESYPKTSLSADTFIYYLKYLQDGFVVISYNGEPAGYILFENSGHLLSIVVKKDFRRKGLGERLINYAISRSKNKLWLEVRPSNRRAIKFYEKIGFKKIKRIPGYYGNEDAIIMRLSKKPDKEA